MDYDNYWFYIEPYVYISIKGKRVLLFNTLDGEYIMRESDDVADFITSLLSPSNCGVVLFKYYPNCSDELISFVNEIREKFMGDIISVNSSLKKPVQPLPNVHIKQELKKTKTFNSQLIQGTDVLQYLSEISIFLNTSCNKNCKYCFDYRKQFLFCSKSKEENDDEINCLKNMIQFIGEYNFNGQINLFGGDFVWLLNNIEEVVSILSPIINKCKVYCYYSALKDVVSTNLFKKEQIILLIDYPIQDDFLNYVKEQGIKYLNIVIKNKEEFIFFESKFETFQESTEIKYLPFYNGKNEDFFITNVFLNKDEILENPKDMQYIHQNMVLNMYSFGKLLIMSNGDIYSNINSTPIGNVQRDSLLKVIYNELTSPKSSWMKTRTKGKCKGCVFQYLCPPISNYEYVFKRFNICQINE